MSNMTSRDDRRLATLATDPETEPDEEALALLLMLLLVAVSFLDEWRILDRPRSNIDEPVERREVLVLARVVSLCVCRLLLRRAPIPSTTASDMIMIEVTIKRDRPNTGRSFMNRRRTEAFWNVSKEQILLRPGQTQTRYRRDDRRDLSAAMIAGLAGDRPRTTFMATACR